jgi:hypothetical protein
MSLKTTEGPAPSMAKVVLTVIPSAKTAHQTLAIPRLVMLGYL